MAKEWTQPKAATVAFDVAMNENGHIAQTADAAAGKKTFSIAGIKTDANLAKSKGVYSAFVTGLAGGRYDEDTGVKTIKYTVTEIEEG